MSVSLDELILQHRQVIRELGEIIGFRRGTISVNFRKCGKKNCACARPGHRGHGPQYLWSATIRGKSYAKNLTLGPELETYQKSTEAYRHFQRLVQKLLQINEKIFELRPIPEVEDLEEWEALRQKLRMQFLEKYRNKIRKSAMGSSKGDGGR